MGGVLTRYDLADLNEGLVARFGVADPPGWDDVSLYYAKALQAMGWKQSAPGEHDPESMWEYTEDDPTAYYFQAAMHWASRWPGFPPAPLDERWSHCTHEPDAPEGMFLPWHRAYIYWYEVIVKSFVSKLGGPDDWALPYWNYSFYDGQGSPSRWPRSRLPWVFCQERLPDGSANPLFIGDPRKRGLQPLGPDGQPMYLSFLTPFYNAAFAETGFAGFDATLDGQPHGGVHVNVGSGGLNRPGWMRNPLTASYDPIFWLHHVEIDRFWVAWNGEGNPNPDDDDWRNATQDPRRDVRWNFWRDSDVTNVITTYPGDMVDPENLGDAFPYSYRYATPPQLPAPAPSVPQRRLAPAVRVGVAARERRPAAMPEIGRAEQPVRLAAEALTAAVPLAAEASRELAPLGERAEQAPRVTLTLEDVTATGLATTYAIYLNEPHAAERDQEPSPHYVGLLVTFGLDHHAMHAAEHGEHHHGVTMSYDITPIVEHLRTEGGWDESEATVTFVPTDEPQGDESEEIAPVDVGRLSIRTD